jgi:hypothetical protein
MSKVLTLIKLRGAFSVFKIILYNFAYVVTFLYYIYIYIYIYIYV